ncbi:hypothetical protein OG21DRAFT_1502221 [Imleria badia]|nr:hypothetical protein OG21DRAFT_1502221 [Imleria badia]
MLYTTPPFDFYTLLQIPQDAPPNDIKIAYHRTLLCLHPDKLKQSRLTRHQSVLAVNATNDIGTDPPPPVEEASVDVALLKEAYRTLSDVGLRAVYDGSLRREEHARSRGPRPAQVVSLEDFTPTVTETDETLGSGTEADADTDAASQAWRYGCRCGGTYRITQDDLESGTHLVGCESCSEVIWVGYEEAPVTEDERE